MTSSEVRKLGNLELSAVVTYLRGTTLRTMWLSDIEILCGGVTVARLKKPLGGKYTQVQALREFRRNPAAFNRAEGWEIASRAGLI